MKKILYAECLCKDACMGAKPSNFELHLIPNTSRFSDIMAVKPQDLPKDYIISGVELMEKTLGEGAYGIVKLGK